LDNNRTPENIQQNHSPRMDAMTPEQRRAVQQGFPTRKDAGNTPPPAANRRPADDGTIPDYMRRGEAPVRRKQMPPVRSDTVTPTRTPAQNRAISSGIPTRSARRPENPAESTLVLDRTALNRLSSADKVSADTAATTVIDRNAVLAAGTFPAATDTAATADTTVATAAENTAETAAPSVQAASAIPFLSDKLHSVRKWIMPGVCVLAAVLLVCIILPLTLSAKQNSTPDFDMSVGAEKDALVLEALSDSQIVGIPGFSVTALPETDSAADETKEQLTPPAPIEKKFQVTIQFFDRESISVSTGKTSLGELLEKIGYTVRDTDRFPYPMETQLTEDATLEVDCVTFETKTEFIAIPYESKVVEVQTIPKGQKQVSQKGKNGSKILTYNVEIVNGQEVNRTLVSETVETQPVNEVSYLGIGGTLTGSDGKKYNYSYYRVVNATYYNIPGLTYLGYEADESVIAVDPNYIPLGTKVYVKNDKYDFGVRTAADTGSGIKEWEVDIWIAANNPQLPAFAYTGYHYDMRIYYLE